MARDRACLCSGRVSSIGFGDAIELLGQGFPAAPTSTTRAAEIEQRTRLGGDQVRPKNEDAAERAIDPGSRPRLTGAHQRLDRDLKVLHIGRSALVQNDEIDSELLHPPIFMRLQHLVGDAEIFDLRNSQQHDWQIARYALRPQTRLRTGALPDDIRRGAQIAAQRR